MSKGLIEHLFDSIIDNIFDDEWLGRRGEKLTERKPCAVTNVEIWNAAQICPCISQTANALIKCIEEFGLFLSSTNSPPM